MQISIFRPTEKSGVFGQELSTSLFLSSHCSVTRRSRADASRESEKTKSSSDALNETLLFFSRAEALRMSSSASASKISSICPLMSKKADTEDEERSTAAAVAARAVVEGAWLPTEKGEM